MGLKRVGGYILFALSCLQKVDISTGINFVFFFYTLTVDFMNLICTFDAHIITIIISLQHSPLTSTRKLKILRYMQRRSFDSFHCKQLVQAHIYNKHYIDMPV